jgi:hypothetical protein
MGPGGFVAVVRSNHVSHSRRSSGTMVQAADSRQHRIYDSLRALCAGSLRGAGRVATNGWFFAISAIVSYAMEETGVRTGFIYGAYHYSDLLGTKLGHVPWSTCIRFPASPRWPQ